MSSVDTQQRSFYQAYKLRLKRKRLLWRSFRSRHLLVERANRTADIKKDSILLVAVVRNEATRLPFFLEYYRGLGVDHFLVVDNGSDDGSAALLADQSDVSMWVTGASYRESRFGLDWQTWLLMKYGTGHWCLTVDVDELLVFKDAQQFGLRGLSAWLDQKKRMAFGALMLDLFPKGNLSDQIYRPSEDPVRTLSWFDPGPYRSIRQQPLGNLWVQGGIREKTFFRDNPRHSPTLNKIPFVKWKRSHAYVNSTHSMLPAKLNNIYDGPGGQQPSGALLHTKFLPEIVSKSKTEKQRAEHFHTPEIFDGYYDALTEGKGLWHKGAVEYQGPEQLENLGLINSPKLC